MTNFFSDKAPPDGVTVPLVHKIDGLYKEVYQLGKRIQKRDHFGIHLKIETLCLDLLELAITASLQTKEEKPKTLRALRIKIEILKRMIRIEHDLFIIRKESYLALEQNLQEISKMTNGWLKYLG